MNVLILSEMDPDAPCGVVTYYKKLMGYFSKDSEVKMTLATIKDASFFSKKLAGLVNKIGSRLPFLGKRVSMIASDVYFTVLLQSALKKYANKKFDIIHVQEGRSAFVAKRFFKGRVPVVMTCHFNDSPVHEEMIEFEVEKPEHKQSLIEKNKKYFRAVDRFIYVSNYCFEKSKFLLADYTKVSVIHNGVDFDAIAQKNGQHAKKDQTLRIINTGHIEKRKNQQIFIPIAQEFLRNNFSDFHITILGKGPELEPLREQIKESGLDAYFSLPGWVNNVDDYLDQADLYIHTALNDNCPYSPIESIARKIPVIGFNVGGLKEILDEKYLFQLNDFQAMIKFMKKNQERLPEIAEEQFAAIEEEFSLKYQNNQVKRLYSSFTQ